MQPCGTCALEPMKYGPHPQLLQMYVAVYWVYEMRTAPSVYSVCLTAQPLNCTSTSDCSLSVSGYCSDVLNGCSVPHCLQSLSV